LYLTFRCQYCQTFTPKFEKLAKIHNHTGLILGKIDGPAYPQITEKYKIYSYPSITLFWQGIDAPIFYVKER
jgi:thiol-disulfide isomerase/thioredoxin